MNALERATAVRDSVLSEARKGALQPATKGVSLVFDAEPVFITDKRGNVIGVDALVRAFRGGNELQIDPHRICINPPTKVRDGTFTALDVKDHHGERQILVPNYKDDAYAAYLEWLFASIADTPNARGFRTKGTVTTVFSTTADGSLYAHGGAWANAYNGTGTIDVDNTSSSNWIGSILVGGTTYYTQSMFLDFDTSSIPDTDTVSDATLSLYGRTGNASRTFEMRAWLYDWGGTLASGDFRTAAQLAALTEVCTWPAASAVGTGAYTNFTNTGTNLASGINKTGTTYIVFSDNLHEGGSTAPTTADDCEWWNAENAGTTNDPKLVVTHAAGGGSAKPMPHYMRRWRAA